MIKLIITLFIFSINTGLLYAAEKIGVLLMHGKAGTALPSSPIGGLAESLESNGFIVLAPDMPWSRQRDYDKTFDESMIEINEKVVELKQQGATKIVVGGHSMGANAALGYGARYDGVIGILAIAPGHLPESDRFQNKIDHDWLRAKKMVEAGHGSDINSFNDVNQGRQREKEMRAEVYLSWFKPNGSAVMPVNIANLKSGTALLWIIGERDRMHDRGKDYAFNHAPENIKNSYIVVDGGHKATPENGKVEIIRWLNNL
ncbi:MAG: alpha/beta fold hydrolase [Sulfuriflexus sp.]|nr:alpha/beta fold hydrolase [Sulfuriflexus sp.]